MNRVLSLLVAGALLACALPGHAQSATPASTDPAATAATAAANDPAFKAAVKNLLDAMQFKDTMDAVFAQMIRSNPALIRKMAQEAMDKDGKLTPDQKKTHMAKVENAILEINRDLAVLFNNPGLTAELADAIVPMYARHFSLAELNDLAAFYRSPLGAKMMATMPQLTAESMQISQSIVLPRMKKVVSEHLPQLGK